MKFETKSPWRHDRNDARPRAMRGGGGREGLGRGAPGRGDESPWRGGRGGRRRMFEGGELRLVLLLLMEKEPRHGYDLIRQIEALTGDAYSPSPGIIYPSLTLLEELSHVEARASEGAKRLYSITALGLAHLTENREAAEMALARLDQLRLKGQAVDAGPVFRAMNNLKAALHQRLGDHTDKQLLFSVADIIDEAARKIERL